MALPEEARPVHCGKCMRGTLLANHIRRGLCPWCLATRLGWPITLAIYGGATVVVGGLLFLLASWTAGHRYSVVSALILVAMLPPLVVLHEAAHAIAALLVGWDVHFVTIGNGPAWKRFRLGRTLIVLNRRPWFALSGFCGTGPRPGAYTPRAIAFIIATPLVLHVAAAGAALTFSGELVSRLFVAANLLLVALIAWPRAVPQAGGTDGKLLLEIWRHPEAARARWLRAPWLNPMHVRLMEDDKEGAFALAERAIAEQPGEEAILQSFANLAVATGRWETAFAHAPTIAALEEKTIPRRLAGATDADLAAYGYVRGPELEDFVRARMLGCADRLDLAIDVYARRLDAAASEEARAFWSACVAFALVLLGRDLERAGEAARYAYLRLPWVSLVETAWGMVTVERGEPAEGLALFGRAAMTDPHGGTAEFRAAWGVAAHAAMGRRDLRMPPELMGPLVWPASRRRAERALA